MKQLLEALDLALESLERMNHADSIFAGEFDKEITAIKQARSAPVQETSIPEGWERRTVVGFDALVEALDYAERKGFMPGYVTSAWEGFNYLAAEKQARSAPVQERELSVFVMEDGIPVAAVFSDGSHAVSVDGFTWTEQPPAAQPTTEKSSAVKPAAPVQEPDHGDELTIAYMSGLHDGKKKREWVSLTDEEIKRIGKLDLDSDYFGLWYDFAKAIEAKLKEKNT